MLDDIFYRSCLSGHSGRPWLIYYGPLFPLVENILVVCLVSGLSFSAWPRPTGRNIAWERGGDDLQGWNIASIYSVDIFIGNN